MVQKFSIIDIRPSKWEFEFQQRESHPTLMIDLWLKAIRDYMPRELRLPVKSPDYLFTATYKGYIKSGDKKYILQKLKNAVKDRIYLQYIFNRTLEVINEFDQIADNIVFRISSKTSIKELAKMWEIIEEKYLRMIPWFYIPWYLTEENVISDRVRLGLKRYRAQIEKIVDINTALEILFASVKKAAFQNEQRDFFELISIVENGPLLNKNTKFQEKAREYLKNYSWMKTFVFLPVKPLSYKELLIRIKEATCSNLLKEYKLQEKNKIKLKTIEKKLFEIFKKDRDLLIAINDSRELGWILTVSVERAIFSTSKLHPFYKSIAKAIGIPYKLWVHLTSDEIMGLLRSEIKISAKDIKKRALATAAVMQKKKINWLWGIEAKQFTKRIDFEIGDVDKNLSEFTGQPASTGKVVGKVCIAVSSAEAKNIAQGEILVTSMTSPDYMPAIRKAAAIVTNEGGLLSHAAIVSRELGKPCIVGTKNATKILKDGDLIEVDANKGIVRKIK